MESRELWMSLCPVDMAFPTFREPRIACCNNVSNRACHAPTISFYSSSTYFLPLSLSYKTSIIDRLYITRHI